MSLKLKEFAKNVIVDPNAETSVSILDEEISSLEYEKSLLLPIESNYCEMINSKLQELKSLQKNIDKTIKFGSNGYLKLSKEPFSWKSSNDLPVFAIFSLQHNECKLYGFIDNNQYRAYNLLSPISSVDIATVKDYPEFIIKQYCYFGRSYRNVMLGTPPNSIYTAVFNGRIPDTTRLKIKEAISVFGENNIFIVTEAAWQPQIVQDTDPLIIGVDGEDIWLIDLFDVIPNEQAFANFC